MQFDRAFRYLGCFKVLLYIGCVGLIWACHNNVNWTYFKIQQQTIFGVSWWRIRSRSWIIMLSFGYSIPFICTQERLLAKQFQPTEIHSPLIPAKGQNLQEGVSAFMCAIPFPPVHQTHTTNIYFQHLLLKGAFRCKTWWHDTSMGCPAVGNAPWKRRCCNRKLFIWLLYEKTPTFNLNWRFVSRNSCELQKVETVVCCCLMNICIYIYIYIYIYVCCMHIFFAVVAVAVAIFLVVVVVVVVASKLHIMEALQAIYTAIR